MKRKTPFFIMLLALLTTRAFSEITVTAPAAKVTVKACPDYATETLRNRMDMNEKTDLGFLIFNGVSPFSIEQPPSDMSNISFAGGIFSARSSGNDIKISVLDTAYPGAAPDGNRNGALYPINADKFKIFAIRMYLEPDISGQYAQFFWSKETAYTTPTTPNGGVTPSNFFPVYNNWVYYLVDLSTLGIMTLPGLRTDPWSGLIDSLRFDPMGTANKNIMIDWIRIVEKGTEYEQTIAWTGAAGNVDIYLDNDTNAANGNLGMLAKNVGGGNYKFLAGALAAGDYSIAIGPTGSTWPANFSYAPGYYAVTDQPILNFTKPSAEGSDQDYVTVSFSDPWDMANPADIEYAVNINNFRFTTLDYEDLAGGAFTNQTVYTGEAAPPAPGNVGDPHAFFLHFLYRGATTPIDTNKYHNLILKMGIAGASSPADGSVARIIYRNKGESSENVGQDIIIRHFGDRWVMHKIVTDLRNLALEPGGGSPSHTGWTGLIDSFRIDPHEFSDQRAFFFDDVKITADWRATTSFTVQWTLEDSDGNARAALYYDTNNSGYDGTLIAQDLTGTSYTWNTAAMPGGTYWLYAVVSDDNNNQNKCYAGGPVIITSGLIPEIKLSKRNLNFGAVLGGIATDSQQVSLVNVGQGTLNWQATVSQGSDWLSVTPASGTGNAAIQIGIKNTNFEAGRQTGTIQIQDPNASNSPQTINAVLNVYYPAWTSPPTGVVDTPLDGESGIEGAIPVTGWAVDDLGVVKVDIWRDPMAGEPMHPNGYVYLGDAVFIDGARPDVEQVFPEYPLNSRAGWGFQVLTNFLPALGNGTFRLHAIATDKEGKTTLLGSKTITCDNAHAHYPFGTIDTPGQGHVTSGAGYVNFAWVLTPQPKWIPTNGQTIWVFVDGAPLAGHPVYNNYRSDIATLFPLYANAAGAVGYYYLNTTTYPDGIHTIAWSATDSNGVVAGIGSRFFSISNAGGGAGVQPTENDAWNSAGGKIADSFRARPMTSAADLAWIAMDYQTPVYVKRGYEVKNLPSAKYPGPDGQRRIEMPEVERVVVYLTKEGWEEEFLDVDRNAEANIVRGRKNSRSQDSGWKGFLIVGEELRPLPIGSTLDIERGIFFWQPGPGFFGEYDFVFIRLSGREPWARTHVKIKIVPKSFSPVPNIGPEPWLKRP